MAGVAKQVGHGDDDFDDAVATTPGKRDRQKAG